MRNEELIFSAKGICILKGLAEQEVHFSGHGHARGVQNHIGSVVSVVAPIRNVIDLAGFHAGPLSSVFKSILIVRSVHHMSSVKSGIGQIQLPVVVADRCQHYKVGSGALVRPYFFVATVHLEGTRLGHRAHIDRTSAPTLTGIL